MNEEVVKKEEGVDLGRKTTKQEAAPDQKALEIASVISEKQQNATTEEDWQEIAKLFEELKAVYEPERDYYIDIKSREGGEEKIFGPDYKALGEIFKGCSDRNYLEDDSFSFGGNWNHINTRIEEGRLIFLEMSTRRGSSKEAVEALKNMKHLDKLKDLVFANSGLTELPEFPPDIESLNVWGNDLKSLPDLSYLRKLKKFICGNNRLSEEELLNIQLPDSIEEVDIRENLGTNSWGKEDEDRVEALIKKLKQRYPKTVFRYKNR